MMKKTNSELASHIAEENHSDSSEPSLIRKPKERGEPIDKSNPS